MVEKYFYLGSYGNLDERNQFRSCDRINVDDIRKLALIVMTLDNDIEHFFNCRNIDFVEEYFKINQNNELKLVYDKIKADMFAIEFLGIDVRLCILENIFRKVEFDNQINEKLIIMYRKFMMDYQIKLQINNNFYEKDYIGEKLENVGKKVLNFRKK